jgi:hypothetical protein
MEKNRPSPAATKAMPKKGGRISARVLFHLRVDSRDVDNNDS